MFEEMENAIQLLNEMNHLLKGKYPANEIEGLTSIICEHLFQVKISQLSRNEKASEPQKADLENIVNRLLNNEPIQYILEESWFYDLKLKVNSHTLIPRSETEELMLWVANENNKKPVRILDIGTGSGCIAAMLSKKLPLAVIDALDVSTEALKIAKQNFDTNHCSIQLYRYDILHIDNPNFELFPSENISQPSTKIPKYDVIVSNPPYVRESEKKMMHHNVTDYEPSLALFVPDQQALIFYEKIADFGAIHLSENGVIYCEINESLGSETQSMFVAKGYKEVFVKKDIHGKNRMLRACI